MQVHILQLQGTGDDEYAWEIGSVCATYEEAVEKLAEFNKEDLAEYIEYGETFWVLDDNARIEVWDVVDNNWGL
jgi:DNA-directed RNA polymerase alpha subunit